MIPQIFNFFCFDPFHNKSKMLTRCNILLPMARNTQSCKHVHTLFTKDTQKHSHASDFSLSVLICDIVLNIPKPNFSSTVELRNPDYIS